LTLDRETQRQLAADGFNERVKAATAGRLFTRHGGNVLPALRG